MTTATIEDNTLVYKGSNYLRQRLVLSLLSKKPVRIAAIREQDEEPGLKEYEVSLLRLLDKVTNGTIIKIDPAGTSFSFRPGMLHGGSIQHDCPTQRGIGYFLEAIVILGPFCKNPLNCTLRGVTNDNVDPSCDLIQTSMLDTLRKFILDDEGLKLTINKRGMHPLGGGEVVFQCPVVTQLKSIRELLDGGRVKRVRGTAYALRVSPALANRMVGPAKGVMLKYLPDVYINTDRRKGAQSGKSPGFGIHLTAETTKGVIYSSELVSEVVSPGGDPSIPEDIGAAAAYRLCKEIYTGGMTDSSCQSVALLCMALGPPDVSRTVLSAPTAYTVGFLRHLREFFGVTFLIEQYDNGADGGQQLEGTGAPDKVLFTCVGKGYKNINKRVI